MPRRAAICRRIAPACMDEWTRETFNPPKPIRGAGDVAGLSAQPRGLGEGGDAQQVEMPSRGGGSIGQVHLGVHASSAIDHPSTGELSRRPMPRSLSDPLSKGRVIEHPRDGAAERVRIPRRH